MNENIGRIKNSIFNIATGMGGQLLTIVLQFITRTVFINTLGASYLGINGLFGDILSMLSVTELGINGAISYRLYKPLAEHDEKRVRVLIKFYRNAYFVVGTIILLLGLAVIPAFPIIIRDYDVFDKLGINAVLVFLLYLLQSVLSYFFFSYRFVIVKADQKEYRLNLVNYCISILVCIAQIAGLILFKNYILYISTMLVFSIVSNLINASISKNSYKYAFFREKERLSREEFRDLFQDLGALFLNNVNSVVEKATDNIVLSTFIGIATVGLYSNYLLFYTTIKVFLGKVCDGIQASLGNLFAVGTTERKYEFFEIMNFIVVVLYGTACVGISVLANEVITCWVGEEYTIAFPFSILIGIEILFLGIKVNLSQIRSISGAFRQMWYRPVICSAINLGVSIGLVNQIGIYGIIIGTIIADVSTNFIFDPQIIYKQVFHRYRHVSEYYIKNIKYFAILSVICFADIEVCTHLWIGYGWKSVIIHIIICAVSVPMTFFLVFHNRHECRYLYQFCCDSVRKIIRRL